MSRQVCGNCLCPYGDDGQCACVEEQVMTTERDCKHGQLARSCNVCELEAEVARQTAEIERLKSTPPDRREDLRCVIADLMRQCQESDALLRQALEALEKTRAFHQQNWSSEEITPKLTRDTIAAIKQHLGGGGSMSHEKERAEFEAWYASAIWGNEDYKQSLFRAWREGREDLIRKLATVSVEPDLIKTDEVDRYGDSIYIEAYSAEALAAARVQENERIRKCLEMFASLMDEAAKLIGQIPTDDIEKLSGYRWPLCDELGGAAAIARDEIHALIGGKE